MNQLTTTNNGILQKSKELRIRDLGYDDSPDSPVVIQLKRVWTLISLKTLPNKDRVHPEVPSEREILLNFIYKNYSSLHPSEIYTAFEKAITREWEVKDYDNWIKCFNDFNADYFARILAPYLIWRKEKISEEMRKTPTLIQEPEPITKFTQLIRYWNLSKTTGNYQIPPHIASNALRDLTDLGVIELTDEEAEHRRGIFSDSEIRQGFLKLHDKAKGFTIERNMGQFKNYCRQIRFKEWATEKLFEEYDLEQNIKEKLGD